MKKISLSDCYQLNYNNYGNFFISPKGNNSIERAKHLFEMLNNVSNQYTKKPNDPLYVRIEPGLYEVKKDSGISFINKNDTSFGINIKRDNLFLDFTGVSIKFYSKWLETGLDKVSCINIEGDNVVLQGLQAIWDDKEFGRPRYGGSAPGTSTLSIKGDFVIKDCYISSSMTSSQYPLEGYLLPKDQGWRGDVSKGDAINIGGKRNIILNSRIRQEMYSSMITYSRETELLRIDNCDLEGIHVRTDDIIDNTKDVPIPRLEYRYRKPLFDMPHSVKGTGFDDRQVCSNPNGWTYNDKSITYYPPPTENVGSSYQWTVDSLEYSYGNGTYNVSDSSRNASADRYGYQAFSTVSQWQASSSNGSPSDPTSLYGSNVQWLRIEMPMAIEPNGMYFINVSFYSEFMLVGRNTLDPNVSKEWNIIVNKQNYGTIPHYYKRIYFQTDYPMNEFYIMGINKVNHCRFFREEKLDNVSSDVYQGPGLYKLIFVDTVVPEWNKIFPYDPTAGFENKDGEVYLTGRGSTGNDAYIPSRILPRGFTLPLVEDGLRGSYANGVNTHRIIQMSNSTFRFIRTACGNDFHAEMFMVQNCAFINNSRGITDVGYGSLYSNNFVSAINGGAVGSRYLHGEGKFMNTSVIGAMGLNYLPLPHSTYVEKDLVLKPRLRAWDDTSPKGKVRDDAFSLVSLSASRGRQDADITLTGRNYAWNFSNATLHKLGYIDGKDNHVKIRNNTSYNLFMEINGFRSIIEIWSRKTFELRIKAKETQILINSQSVSLKLEGDCFPIIINGFFNASIEPTIQNALDTVGGEAFAFINGRKLQPTSV